MVRTRSLVRKLASKSNPDTPTKSNQPSNSTSHIDTKLDELLSIPPKEPKNLAKKVCNQSSIKDSKLSKSAKRSNGPVVFYSD